MIRSRPRTTCPAAARTSAVARAQEIDIEQGLSEAEVGNRRLRFGPNRLTPKPGKGPLLRFLLQFAQPLVLMLLLAGAVTAFAVNGSVAIHDYEISLIGETSEDVAHPSNDRGEPASSDWSGTVAYMAPERLRGERGDARSDIFSLGVVLYEMLAGARPFQGEHPQAVSWAIVNGEPPALAGIPADLSAILHRALAKSPSRRQASMRELDSESPSLRVTVSPRRKSTVSTAPPGAFCCSRRSLLTSPWSAEATTPVPRWPV